MTTHRPEDVPLLLPADVVARPSVRTSAVKDGLVIVLTVAGFFWLACSLELSERFIHWASAHENLQVDEWPLTLLVLTGSLWVFAHRRMRELAVEVEARRHAENVALKVSEQNRLLARQLISLQEQERRHLARELHDEIGQYCVAIKVDASTIERDTAAQMPRAFACAVAIGQTADHLHSVVRGLLERLRPTALDDLGLHAALQVLTDTWGQRHGVACVLTATGPLNALGETANITLYRIVQECLTNIARHAAARHVEVDVSVQIGANGIPHLALSVRDDGTGLSSRATRSGMGLVGMRERAQALGGTFNIHTQERGGTCLQVAFPVGTFAEVTA